MKNNDKMYSRIQGASQMSSFGPPVVVVRMLDQETFIQRPITSDDILKAGKIYGKFFQELCGKAVRLSGFDTISVEPTHQESQ